jgi:ABC-type glutathione transport system ATPase component
MNSTPPLLSLEEIEIAYPKPDGKGWMRIVHDLNLQLELGGIACLLGPSG